MIQNLQSQHFLELLHEYYIKSYILLYINVLYKNLSVIKHFVLRKLVCFCYCFCMLLFENNMSFCCHGNMILTFDS